MKNTKPKSKKLLSTTSPLHLSSSSVYTGNIKTNLSTELCLALSICSDLSPPLRGNCARRSPASPTPDQVCACPGVLSTQVVFNEPADLNILYLTRRWFGPCSPAVLAGGSATAFTTLSFWGEMGERQSREELVRRWYYQGGWENTDMQQHTLYSLISLQFKLPHSIKVHLVFGNY